MVQAPTNPKRSPAPDRRRQLSAEPGTYMHKERYTLRHRPVNLAAILRVLILVAETRAAVGHHKPKPAWANEAGNCDSMPRGMALKKWPEQYTILDLRRHDASVPYDHACPICTQPSLKT